MKSLQFSAFGNGADVIEVVDIAEPQSPQAGEVIAEVEYTPINPAELLMIRGLYGVKPPLPAPLGNEGVARVVSLGRDVTNLQIGDRVIVPQGNPVWRERIVLKAAGLESLPDSADPQQLSMVRTNPPTAGILLNEFSDLKRGDWIVQNAGNSGVGRNVIAFARELGIKTVSLVRREELVADLQAAGGDVVLVDTPGVAKQIAQATGGAKIFLAFDGVAGEATASLSASLTPGGKLVFYAGMSGKPGVLNPIHVIFKNISVVGFWLGYPEWSKSPKVAEHVATAVRLIDEGKLKVPVAAIYPLTAAKEAITHAQRGGKILFKPTG
ncbi:zinc-dependent alcohol dehydrogenase family protein [Bradyrhizobium sp. GCM10027634]|uniref:zinc-dependent alcohol dehydrogenase family protein n=1 Tax=unclassified Bradyrhizobium TaxID=2631580 RepID=UPI00263B2542|nr:zinc-dependent alcohol dehydrogenase family protein [Bradyrhizobium sp. WYCCWR 12677]MDN5005500.1 zinc-dependent alcohol dehydrogenase family protein [Bradyrhizobium sp. WYCCWR 12677]